jgi:predicted dehydrogenase
MNPSRRAFLASTALPAFAAQAPADPPLRLAILGAGGRGNYNLGEIRKANQNCTITAICDVWKVARERAAAAVQKTYGQAPKLTSRYEDVLAMKDVDAVVITTPDFTHSRILLDAVQAGKDAYCEKPMGTEFNDARAAYKAVKASNRVVQIGTQRRSDGGLIACANFLRSGALGRITRADLQAHYQEARWRRPYNNINVDDIDWEAFRFHGRIQGSPDLRKFREWQLFSDLTNGIPGLWMSHFIDLAAWFLDDPYPQSAVSSGGVYQWKDGRETSDVFHTLVEYKDCLISFVMTLTSEVYWRNHWFGMNGTLDADKLTYSGEGSRQPEKIKEPGKLTPETVDSHMANWLKCLRSRQTPRADIQAGFSHAVAGIMSARALEAGRRIRFDRDKLEIL